MRRIVLAAFDISLIFFGKVLCGFYYLFDARLVFFIGKLIGFWVYRLNKLLRELTKNELALLFGKKFDDEELEKITKKSIEHYYMRNIETLFFGILNKGRVNKIIQVEGMKNLDESLSKGKGVILLIAHFGSFLLPLSFLGFLGYKVNQITGKQLHRSSIEERIWAWRKREADKLPVRFMQVDGFLRPIYDALRNNEIVSIAFDGRDGSKWVAIDFFQRVALFSAGPFELARRTGSTILPAFIIREKNLTHKLVFEAPFELSQDTDIATALNSDTRNFAKLLANYISQYPCHFGWLLFKMKKLQKAGIKYTLFQDK